VGDLLDAPGGGAEDEGVAGAGFEDHLLVELADTDGLAVVASEKDAVEAAVGNGAAVKDGDALDAGAGCDPVAGAVPGDAGAQVRELVGGVAAGEHVEDAIEDGLAHAREGAAPRTSESSAV